MDNQITDFAGRLRRFYDESGRHDMPWRQPLTDGSFDPYRILVSEIMLQQTQVNRVIPKYEQFLATLPTVIDLAAAGLAAVLLLWIGLGYNRRAKFLWQSSQVISYERGGAFPEDLAGLQSLPGIGPNTAGAIMAYAYDKPVAYLETNIRTVLIHEFFHDSSQIAEGALRDVLGLLLAKTGQCPRQFYWALMDYGAFLKQTVGNPNRQSASYAKQTAFHGSLRQLRGQALRLLAERPYQPGELVGQLADGRTNTVIDALLSEALIRLDGGFLKLG